MCLSFDVFSCCKGNAAFSFTQEVMKLKYYIKF